MPAPNPTLEGGGGSGLRPPAATAAAAPDNDPRPASPSTSAPPPPPPPTEGIPDFYINPADLRRAWLVDILLVVVSMLGVVGFNFATAHSVSDWLMPVAFQLALLGGAEFLRIPFAIKCRTATSPVVSVLAFIGLMLGTGITAITLYQTAVMAFAPKFAALEVAEQELAGAEAADAAFKIQYEEKKNAVTALENRVKDDIDREKGASADLGKQAPVCTKHKCQTAPQAKELGKNLADARAEEKIDREALAAARSALTKMNPDTTAQAVAEKKAAEAKAASEEIFHRMASDMFGYDLTKDQMTWVKRLTIGLPCLFVSLAGALFAFCSVHPIKRKPEPELLEIPDSAVLATLNYCPDVIAKEVSPEFTAKLVPAAVDALVPALVPVLQEKLAEAGKENRAAKKKAKEDAELIAAVNGMAGDSPAAKSAAPGNKPETRQAANLAALNGAAKAGKNHSQDQGKDAAA